MKNWHKISILAALLIGAVIMSGCAGIGSTDTTLKPTATPTVSITTTAVPATPALVTTFIQSEKSKNTNTPITLKFSMSKIPVVNEETVLRVEVNSIFNAQGTSVKIELPQNVELVRGSIDTTLDLKANQPESFDTVIKFKQSGNYQLTALAHKQIDQDNSWGDLGVFYLTIGDLQSNITTFKPTASNATTSDSSTPITVNLTQSKIPIVNEETTLRVEVNSILNASGTNVKLILPPGADLISGSLEKNIDLQANAPESFETIIKFTKPGNFKITAEAHKIIDQDNSWGDMDVLYLTIGDFNSQLTTTGSITYAERAQLVSEEPHEGQITTPPQYLNIESLRGVVPDQIPVDSNVKSAEPDFIYSPQNNPNNNTDGSGTLTVTGSLSYYTKVIGGEIADYRDTDDTLVPLKQAYVEIKDATTSDYLGYGYLNNNGEFSINIVNPYPHSFNVFYYAIGAYNDPSGTYRQLRVVSQGSTLIGLTDVWTVYSGPIATTDGSHTQNIGSWNIIRGNDYEHAFMLFQDLISTRDFIGWDVGSSTINWNPTSTDGTYYRMGEQIHLVGEDYKSADTSIHEFGHNYMWTKKGSWTNTCPNPHYFEKGNNQQCAYTEGWANYLSLTANNNPVYTWASGATLNLETPTWGTPSWWDNGDGCEGRVAGALWDMYDGANDGYDLYQYSFSSTDIILKQNPQFTFRSFWDTWKTAGYSQNAVESIYQNTINYRDVVVPTVTGISPTSGLTSGGTSVAITGTGFTGATAVKFGSTSATSYTVNSATSITATSPAQAAGTVDVTVTTPGGTSATSAASKFTYSPLPPTVTGISPAYGPTTGGTRITVTGTGFTGATAVSVGGTPPFYFTINSDTSITASTPVHAVGHVDVTVTTPGGTSAISAADKFTYGVVPTVTSISPTTGPSTGGTRVTITGTGFTGATAVSVGGTPSPSFTVNSDTSITASTPAGTGTVDITVINLIGGSATSAADQFTYVVVPKPNVLYATNASGTQGQDTVVGIYLNNSYNPKAGAITYKVYYNETLLQAKSITVASGGVAPINLASPFTVAYASASGYPNGNTWLGDVTFQPKVSDNLVTPVRLTLEELVDVAIPPKDLVPDTSVQNGYFTIGGGVQVNVIDANGNPMTADRIALESGTGTMSVTGVNNYRFNAVPTGTYQLNVTKSGYLGVNTTISYSAGSMRVLTATLVTHAYQPTVILAESGVALSGMSHTAPERLNALRNETDQYNLTLNGGGVISVALEYPMRYQLNRPQLTSALPIGTEMRNGTFLWTTPSYTTTNATLIVTATPVTGQTLVGLKFTGGKLGDVYYDTRVTSTDSLYDLHYVVTNLRSLSTYDYADVTRDGKITSTDALYILHYVVGNVNEYYQAV